MSVTMIACQGTAGRRLMDQVGAVLDPLTRKYRYTAPHTLRPVIRRAWREAFRVELPEPALSRCVAAISKGQPWQLALWSNDL
jgi:hypothetical protein